MFSEQDLLDFIDKMSEKHQIAHNTTSSRRLAVSKVLECLSREEKKELNENLDLTNLFNRFKEKSSLAQASKDIYESRFKTVFKNYVKWTKDPDFIPRSRQVKAKDSANLNKGSINLSSQSALCDFNIPIPFSNISGLLRLPSKLSRVQAKKINEFIQACTNILILEENNNENNN